MKYVTCWLTVTLCAGISGLSAQDAEELFSQSESKALKRELYEGDNVRALERISEKSKEADDESTESFKLLRTFMELQSSDEWESNRSALNMLMREVLSESGKLYTGPLDRSNRDDGGELILMGKLYDAYLYDGDGAKDCYMKVVGRYLSGRSTPVSSDDWKQALQATESLEVLNADERYAFKRLMQMRQLEETITYRIAYAKEQEEFKAEMALAVQPEKPEFNPDDSVPFDALREQMLREGGQK